MSFDWCYVARVTIDLLPDVVLLETFHFYVDNVLDVEYMHQDIEAWTTLVHVCRKWRQVILGSPLRLNLRLYCTGSTPVGKTLEVWPMLPIFVLGSGQKEWDVDNLVSVLEHNDRICELSLGAMQSSGSEEVLAAMQKSFPALVNLDLQHIDASALVPASFLRGSAPQLEFLTLHGITFPGLPKLLLSATNLVRLQLHTIPQAGYISPQTMVRCLSVLTRLEYLFIGFKSHRSRPDRRRPPPPTRTFLPVLTEFDFSGVSEYLEDLVAQIDAPLLKNLGITFFHQLIFDTPQLTQFISRTPKLKPSDDKVEVEFSSSDVSVGLPQTLGYEIKCKQPDWQLSALAQVCNSSFPRAFIHAVEHLYIYNQLTPLDWQDDIEGIQWLEFFRPFTFVKSLYISSQLTPHIMPTLLELIGETGIEVLPSLRTLFVQEPPLSGPVQETVEKFVAARQLAGNPVAVSGWEGKKDDDEWYESDEEEDESSSSEADND